MKVLIFFSGVSLKTNGKKLKMDYVQTNPEKPYVIVHAWLGWQMKAPYVCYNKSIIYEEIGIWAIKGRIGSKPAIVYQGVPWICWSFFTGIFLLGGSHLWPYLVNMGTSIIWCDSNIKVQYFSVWLWYTLCSPLMAYHHSDRLHVKVSWLLPNHIPIKLLFLFITQLN